MTYGVNAPLGLQACSYGLNAPWTGAVQIYNIPIVSPTVGYATNLFLGDLVTFNNGFLNKYTPGGGLATAPIGVYWGCTFTDGSGVVQIQKYWPASQSIMAGSYPIANVITDPNAIFTIQLSNTLAWSNLDKNADVTFATPGNPLTGESGMMLDTTTVATNATLPLHIIDFDPIPGNVPNPGGTSIQYANVRVKMNATSINAGAQGV